MSSFYGDGVANSSAQQKISLPQVRSSSNASFDDAARRARAAEESSGLGRRIFGFVAVIQIILFLGHWFVYETWVAFRGGTSADSAIALTLSVLSVSFVVASLLAHRFYNSTVRVLYRVAATWLGFLNFFFLAAGLNWLIYLVCRVAGVPLNRGLLAALVFGLAAFAAIVGIVNARSIRVKRITVKLPNLPASWRGRIAALISDVHLGHVNGAGFMSRIVSKVRSLQPNVVFLTGDLYDGTKVDADRVAAPLKDLSPAFGSYFVTGNHEEFSDPTKFLDGVSRAGVRVLNNEKVTIDGLQVVGVHFSSTTRAGLFQSILDSIQVDETRPSILLSHAPHALEVAEKAGISLQLSGHTHRGQVFPFTWFTKRIFGAYTYGLQRFGRLTVYTTSGVGTWGPPLRLGTSPEVVLIEFA